MNIIDFRYYAFFSISDRRVNCSQSSQVVIRSYAKCAVTTCYISTLFTVIVINTRVNSPKQSFKGVVVQETMIASNHFLADSKIIV